MTDNWAVHDTRPESANMNSGARSAWPHFEKDEIDAVNAVLASGRVNYWTGTEGRSFEEEFSRYFGVRYGIALANGSVALELALKGLGVGPGDEVLVTPRSFFASVGCVLLCGARPVFADVDNNSQNVTVATLAAAMTPATKAVIPVHLWGWPCDMGAISAFADEHRLYVIEDCAQAHGATWNGRKVGSFGRASAFSFCQDKIITTGGEGGMLLTSSEELWRTAWSFKDHGKEWDSVYRQDYPPGYRWLHESVGTNLRMTEMQAAIGRAQLGKLDEWLRLRRRNAEILTTILREVSCLRVPVPPKEVGHAYYKFSFFVRPESLKPGWSRDRIMVEIQSQGVPCLTGTCPEIYMEKAFDQSSLRPRTRLPVAKVLGETSLVLLVDPRQSEEDMIRAGEVTRTVALRAQR